MIYLILFGLGLIFGSFVNALVWRLHEQSQVISLQSLGKKVKKLTTRDKRQETHGEFSILHGRSMCVNCRHELAAIDLIPVVSWLMLRGRCRYCRRPIAWQYPMVELVTGGLFAVSYAFWPRMLDDSLEVAYLGLWLITLIIMVALAVYDLRWMELPDKIVRPFIFIGLASILVISFLDSALALDKLKGILAIWGFFAVIYYGSRGRWIGGGDVKFAVGMGAWLGLKLALAGVLAAFYSASLVILPLLALGMVKRKQAVPFGPFLIIGTIIAVLWGQELVDWYQQKFLLGGV